MVAPFAGLLPFQIAFVVRDVERAVRNFDAVLGAGPWRGYIFNPSTVNGWEYRGRQVDSSVRLVLNDRRPQIELIEPVTGESIHHDWLHTHGEGFHHLAYTVDTLEETTSQMTAAGYPAIQRGHSFGHDRDGAFAYYDTTDTLGFIIEAVQPPGRLPDPAFRL